MSFFATLLIITDRHRSRVKKKNVLHLGQLPKVNTTVESEINTP